MNPNFKRILKKYPCLFILYAFLICNIIYIFILNKSHFTAYAQNSIPITSYEELLKIKENPSGNYILMNDLDLSGKNWIPLTFTGTFDGNGHSILNVTIKETGTVTRTSYDGNMKTYDTVFCGFFDILEEEAVVSNLNLINIRVDITCDTPCFIGGIAGYMDKSSIKDCTISGNLSLKTTANMFGVGGIAGFGNGTIDRTNADMTLICIDTNKIEKNEQFLGGAYATGYIGLGDCNVTVNGFVSDYGYVHNGGLVGMFALYPAGTQYTSYITNNHIEGVISFFEDNEDRRAYCAEYVGEVLNWSYDWGGCTANFTRDEHYDYDTILLPDMCENPQYNKTVTESSDEQYGYTTYTCSQCGYSYTDNYTLYQSDLKAIEDAKKESLAAANPTQASTNSITNKTDSSQLNNDTSTDSLKIVICVITALLILIIITMIIVNIYLRRQRYHKKNYYKKKRR